MRRGLHAASPIPQDDLSSLCRHSQRLEIPFESHHRGDKFTNDWIEAPVGQKFAQDALTCAGYRAATPQVPSEFKAAKRTQNTLALSSESANRVPFEFCRQLIQRIRVALNLDL